MYLSCEYEGIWSSDEDQICRAFIRENLAQIPTLPMVSSSGAMVDYYPCCYLADFLCKNVDSDWHSAFDGVLSTLGDHVVDGVSLCSQLDRDQFKSHNHQPQKKEFDGRDEHGSKSPA